MSEAFTEIPILLTNTTLSCFWGNGTHPGNFAFSRVCTSKINDKLSINYAASMTIPSQDYVGDFEDTFSAKTGFVLKLAE